MRIRRARNCWPWVRSFTNSPVAVIHSPGATVAACPTTVTSSRWPRARVLSTQRPVCGLWKTTRSTGAARTSRSGDSACRPAAVFIAQAESSASCAARSATTPRILNTLSASAASATARPGRKTAEAGSGRDRRSCRSVAPSAPPPGHQPSSRLTADGVAMAVSLPCYPPCAGASPHLSSKLEMTS